MKNDDTRYRAIIDHLVGSSRAGQGQIAVRRALSGAWPPAGHAMNRVLKRLPKRDREVLARALAEQFTSGVHETLAVLHEHQVAPLDRAYEGTPFHDFVGRLADWSWPSDDRDRT